MKTSTKKAHKNCTLCKGRGYIYTLQVGKDATDHDTIERCDDCKVFKSDFEAIIQARKDHNTPK